MSILGVGSAESPSLEDDHIPTSDDLKDERNPRDYEQPEDGVESPATGSIVSLSDSILQPSYENGRSYHRFREGSYPFPNDEREQEREALVHEVMAMVCRGLHLAPLMPDTRNILDIGTGTGLWAMEMGDEFPHAEILGSDLSAIQQEWVPPNVNFEIDDVESDWLHPVDHFDFIHSRHIGLGIRNWPRLLHQSYRHIAPSGWLEMLEVDYQPKSWDSHLEPEHPVAQYWSTIYGSLRRLGIHQQDVVTQHCLGRPRLVSLMEAAGFTNVHTRSFILPIGPWPKDPALKAIGSYWRLVLLDGAEAMALAPLTRGREWSRPRVEMLAMQARQGYMDISRLFMTMYVVVGQKPNG